MHHESEYSQPPTADALREAKSGSPRLQMPGVRFPNVLAQKKLRSEAIAAALSMKVWWMFLDVLEYELKSARHDWD
jgi:hypothetical protein